MENVAGSEGNALENVAGSEGKASENVAGFDLQVKACAEALQSAQKRVRIAFFLTLAASCIVLLMVANLWESRQVRNTAVIRDSSPNQTEYLKEISKHVADDSFYQVPALGIQITCENVGILGPLGLLVFSLYCFLAFKGCYCHVHCATQEQFKNSPLIMALLESEQSEPLPHWWSVFVRVFLFLPGFVCAVLILYEVFAHFLLPLGNDPLRGILIKNRRMVIAFDAIGFLAIVLVVLLNSQTFRLSELTDKAARATRRTVG